MTEIQQVRDQLANALGRIQKLEEKVAAGQQVPGWQFLIARPHPWRRQLSIKGRNMTVGQMVSTIRANGYTPEQASEDLNLPVAAVREALQYHSENRELISMEAAEERRLLAERGYALEPKDLPR